MEPLMTVADVAKYLKVIPRTVYSFLETGTLKGIKIGRSWRIRRQDLEKLADESATPAFDHYGNSRGAVGTDVARTLSMELLSLADDESSDLIQLIRTIVSERRLRRLKRAFDMLPCAALVVDAAGNVTEANSAAARLFKSTESELKNMNIASLPGMRAFAEIEGIVEVAQRAGGNAVVLPLDGRQEGKPLIRCVLACSSGPGEAIVQLCCGCPLD